MPLTPLHMGPAMLVKAAAPRRFSIVTFGLTQIACDLEVLWFLVRWDPPLHRFWHTLAGVSIIAAVMAVAGKPLSDRIKAAWNRVAVRCRDADITVPATTSRTAAISGALVGAYSHLLIDALYHRDLLPFSPLARANPLRGLAPPWTIDAACVALGVVGLAWYLAVEIRRRRLSS